MSDDENKEGLTLPVYYRNHQWAVTGYGIEAVRPGARSQYHLSHKQLDEVRENVRLPNFPLHMAGKGWVLGHYFLPAFCVALVVHNVKFKLPVRDDWYLIAIREFKEYGRYDDFEAGKEIRVK